MPSSFCLLATRSVASIVVILMLATIPCNTEINVFNNAIGADMIATNLNNDMPNTTKRLKNKKLSIFNELIISCLQPYNICNYGEHL